MNQQPEKKESDIEFVLRLLEMLKDAARMMEKRDIE